MKKFLRIVSTTTLVSLFSVAAYSSFAQTNNSGSASSPGRTNTGTMSVTPGGSKSGTASGNYNNNNTRAGSNTSGGAGAPDDIQSGGSVNWNTENTYWRSNYPSRPYYNKSRNYSVYEPAYRYGVDLYNKNTDKSYEDLNQAQLRTDWEQMRGKSTLTWEQAQDAVRDSYNRAYQSNLDKR